MSIHTTSQPVASSTLKHLLISHPLVAYFVFAYGFAWLTWLPFTLAKNGFGLLSYTVPGPLIYLLEVLATFVGPTLSAFMLTAVTSGRAGMRQLLQRYIQGHIGLQWYLLVLLGIPCLLVLAASVSFLLFGATSLNILNQRWLQLVILYLPFVAVSILGGPLGEEPGWRGFALPRLQQHFGAVPGSLILGVLWGLWHLPLFLVIGADGPFNTQAFVLFIIGTVIFTLCFTWIYNNVGGSLLLMILLHSAVNTISSLVILLSTFFPHLGLILYIVYASCALLIIIFTKGRLSYKSDRDRYHH